MLYLHSTGLSSLKTSEKSPVSLNVSFHANAEYRNVLLRSMRIQPRLATFPFTEWKKYFWRWSMNWKHYGLTENAKIFWSSGHRKNNYAT